MLVKNAGNFFACFFEELSPEQFEQQLTTNLGGLLNVTRAVLPAMRGQLQVTSSRFLDCRHRGASVLFGLRRLEVRA